MQIVNPNPRPSKTLREVQRFVPPRLSQTFPVLGDEHDVDFAVSLRGGIRRAINRGQPDVAAYFAGQAAELVQSRTRSR